MISTKDAIQKVKDNWYYW